jgi:hypothetical protein
VKEGGTNSDFIAGCSIDVAGGGQEATGSALSEHSISYPGVNWNDQDVVVRFVLAEKTAIPSLRNSIAGL